MSNLYGRGSDDMHHPEAEGLIFVDFEASGLGRDSFPIEIGLSWIDGDAVTTWSSLIRPSEDWNLDAWSATSARIHGISLEELATAPAASGVAEQAWSLLCGKMACSDAPEFDEFWAGRLFWGLPQAFDPRIHYVHSVFDYALTRAGSDRAYETLASLPAPHRAGPDAERYAQAFLSGLRAMR
jgi:DNA polymerase III subunit epsilon